MDLQEAIATTWAEYGPEVADNVSNNIPVLKALKDKGKYRKLSGGRELRRSVAYDENSSFTSYSPHGVLNVGRNSQLIHAKYDWRYGAVTVQMSEAENLMNSGESQIYDHWGELATNAGRTLKNQFSSQLHSNGQGNNGLDIDGFQAMLTTTPTAGTYGGLNRGTYDFWRQKHVAAATTGPDLVLKLNQMHLATRVNNETADLIIMGDRDFNFYEDSTQGDRRYMSAKMGDAGFENYAYKGAMILPAGGLGGYQADAQTYLLQCSFIEVCVHEKRDFASFGGTINPVDQDVMVQRMGWMANLVCSNLRQQAIIG